MVVRSTVVVLGDTTEGRTLVVVVLVVVGSTSRLTLMHPVNVGRTAIASAATAMTDFLVFFIVDEDLLTNRDSLTGWPYREF